MTTTTRKTRTTRTTRTTTKADITAAMRLWAHRYVCTAATLSAGLNGFAGYAGADGWQVVPAVTVNAMVPILAFMLGRVAGMALQSGRARLALAVATIATILLILSIAHCATALTILTGSGMVGAVMMATVIDAGMLVTEYATVAK